MHNCVASSGKGVILAREGNVLAQICSVSDGYFWGGFGIQWCFGLGISETCDGGVLLPASVESLGHSLCFHFRQLLTKYGMTCLDS